MQQKDGVCYLCAKLNGDIRLHRTLQKDGQQVFEETHTREEFMKMFGRNYID